MENIALSDCADAERVEDLFRMARLLRIVRGGLTLTSWPLACPATRILNAGGGVVSHVFVTGAGGFIGSVVARALAVAGHRVSALHRGPVPTSLVAAGVTAIKAIYATRRGFQNAMTR